MQLEREGAAVTKLKLDLHAIFNQGDLLEIELRRIIEEQDLQIKEVHRRIEVLERGKAQVRVFPALPTAFP